MTASRAWENRLRAWGVTPALWRATRRLFAATLPAPCTVCGDLVQPWADWHLDHRVPVSRGGAVIDPANLGPAHARCNRRKGNTTDAHEPTSPHHVAGVHVRPSREW